MTNKDIGDKNSSNIFVTGPPSEYFNVEQRGFHHKQAILLALRNIRAAKACMVVAASIAWVDTNPMTTKRLDECEKMLSLYE